MLYTLVVACSLIVSQNHGSICMNRTVATGLTEDQCTQQSIGLQIKAMDQGQSVYCIPQK